MVIKCNLCYLFMAVLISTIICTVAEGRKQQTEEEYHENNQENMKDIIAHELEPLQKIIFEFQNTIISKMDKITDLEYNLNHKMKDITDKFFKERSTNITKDTTGNINAIFTTINMLLTSTQNINNRLVKIENDLQNSIGTKFYEKAGLDDAINRKIKEITHNILLDQTENITKQISDQIYSTLKEHMVLEGSKQKEILTLMENINTKLELLENIPKLELCIQKLHNASKQIETAQATNQTTEALKNCSNHLQQCGTGTENDKMFSWCDSVPISVHIRDDIWKSDQAPAEDDLDRFLVQKTGCTYKAVEHYSWFALPAVTYNGTLYEWRGAVRAGEGAYIGLDWTGNIGYSIYIDYYQNKDSWGADWNTGARHPLPARDYVFRDRYVRFYVSLQSGTVTFGRECDSAPLYIASHPTIAQGTPVTIHFYGESQYGVKYLYDCPAVLPRSR